MSEAHAVRSGTVPPVLTMWLAAAGITVALVVLARATSWAAFAFAVGNVASLPMLAWFLSLRQLTGLLGDWPRGAWVASALSAYVLVGLVYALVRWMVLGTVGAWIVPLVWPSLAVVDALYALGLTGSTLGN